MPSAEPEFNPPPPPANGSSVHSFVGNFPFMVDGQWRVTIPAEWRLAEGAKFYFRLHAHYLQVLPQEEADRFRMWANTDLKGMERTAALAKWGRTTKVAVVDQAGRLTLPRDWAKEVGLDTKEKAMLEGVTEFFHIWKLDRYQTDVAGLQALGDNVMGRYG